MKKTFAIMTILYSQSIFALTLAEHKAHTIYNRLTAVAPTPTQLADFSQKIEQGDINYVVYQAMDNERFYTTVLKQWIKPWTNVQQSSRVPFNDYVATVIGVIRDNLPFDQILYGDILYHIPYLPGEPHIRYMYMDFNNVHYSQAEGMNLKLSLAKESQTALNGITDSAGVLTSRAAGEAFYSMGTNRRMTKYTFINFMCKDFVALHDINVPDWHVRKDVERSPGNDSRTYKSNCVGCHAGQDALGGAFAYYDFVGGKLVHTPGQVVAKVIRNPVYRDGFQTKTDSWINLWSQGQNANLGWRGPQSGNGVRGLGRMLARSRAFSECISKKVFSLVCIRTPVTDNDKSFIQSAANSFEANQEYDFKKLVAQTAEYCI